MGGLSLARAQSAPLLDALSQELDRNFTVLKQNADPAPYFIGYEVSDEEIKSLSASWGSVSPLTASHSRALDVSVRVGSRQLDNYHRTSGSGGAVQSTAGSISYEDAPDAIKRVVWLETDRAYRVAAERLARIKTNTQVRVA